MIQALNNIAKENGDKLQFISVEYLSKLAEELKEFKRTNTLNDFQNWIVDNLYSFSIPKDTFLAQSILLVAIQHPSYSSIDFSYDNQVYTCINPAVSDFNKTKTYLTKYITSSGYHLLEAPNLPLKRLAAHTGLAKYGKNNICYIDEWGSFFSLLAFYTDIPCNKNTWHELTLNNNCNNCTICLENCPTGAISANRFLIDNCKCISLHNENPDSMPDWIPKSAHHTMYDCLKCQMNCPMNYEAIKNVATPIHITEDEIKLILNSESFDILPTELKQKLEPIGLDSWYGAIPRNIQLLMDTQKEIVTI